MHANVEDGTTHAESPTMNRLLGFVGMTVGGWLGWWIGAWLSIFTAFVLSMVGTGVGLYAAHRWTRNYF